jgi:uncharacterized protein YidB (DUF937 family)
LKIMLRNDFCKLFLLLIDIELNNSGDMRMFDIIIREAASRFGLGDTAGPLVQMLLVYITDKKTGGIAGFMSKLKSSDLDSIAQSWLGGSTDALPLSRTQIETLFGGHDDLLNNVTSKLGIGGSTVSSAISFLLPLVIGKLTPGGSIPTSLSREVTTFITCAAPGRTTAASVDVANASGSGLLKWLPWFAAGIAALILLSYFNKGSDAAKQAADGAKNAAAMAATAAEDRMLLEKPADATGSALSNAEARRLEVTIHK